VLITFYFFPLITLSEKKFIILILSGKRFRIIFLDFVYKNNIIF